MQRGSDINEKWYLIKFIKINSVSSTKLKISLGKVECQGSCKVRVVSRLERKWTALVKLSTQIEQPYSCSHQWTDKLGETDLGSRKKKTLLDNNKNRKVFHKIIQKNVYHYILTDLKDIILLFLWSAEHPNQGSRILTYVPSGCSYTWSLLLHLLIQVFCSVLR